MATSTILGTGVLEVDFPGRLTDPNGYRWDQIVALFNPDADAPGNMIEFPQSLVGQRGTLVAIVLDPPRAKLNAHDHAVRQGAPIQPRGTRLVLGTGEVFLRARYMGGNAGASPRAGIGVKPRLDGDAVRSLMFHRIQLDFER